MAREKKKQHFVPRSYYKNFCLNETEQLYVYDKESKKTFKSNIKDIAQERYFNDLDITNLLPREFIQSITEKNKDTVEKINDSQWIENGLANLVEADLNKMLQKVISKVERLTPWEERNCKCFTHEEKLDFSIHLAIQTIRTKRQRDMITDISSITNKLYKDVSAIYGSPIEEKRYQLSEEQAKNTHLMMMLDMNHIMKLASIYTNYQWVLLINQTHKPFYTSDHPIANIPHSYKGQLSNDGLLSEGIEVFYPISNSVALTMFDGEFHKWIGDRDCIYSNRLSEEAVSDYNKWIILRCNRFIYSTDERFEDIHELLEVDPSVFDHPSMIAYFGDKKYEP